MSLKRVSVTATFSFDLTLWNDKARVDRLIRDAEIELPTGAAEYGQINEVELEHVTVMSEARTAVCTNPKCSQRDTYEDDVDLFDNVVEVEKATPKGNPYIIGTCPLCRSHVYRIKD